VARESDCRRPWGPARATTSRSGTRLALGAYGLNSRHSSFCLVALGRLHACASGGPFATLDGAATGSRRLRSALRRESGTCLPLSAPHLAASEAPTRARGVERAVPAAQVVSGARSFSSVFRRAPIRGRVYVARAATAAWRDSPSTCPRTELNLVRMGGANRIVLGRQSPKLALISLRE